MIEALPRITGTETEFGGLFLDHKGAKVDLTKSLIYDHLDEDLEAVDEMLSNASRLYPDIGNHLEYATPEDADIWGTVANEIAGEEIATSTLTNICHDEGNHFKTFRLNKRLIDDSEVPVLWGHHENYYSPGQQFDIDSTSLALLGLHAISRSVWSGAGCVVKEPGQSHQLAFYVAQKDVTGKNYRQQQRGQYCSSGNWHEAGATHF